MLPRVLLLPLREQLARSRALWAADRAAERSGVYLRTPNTRGRGRHGPGIGCFHRQACRLTPAQASSGGITCLKSGWVGS